MKKTLILAVCMVLVASAAFAGTVVNSKHDLSTGVSTTTGANDEVCVFCHTPHNASTTPLAPLWSHASTGATYTVYSNTFGTLNGTTGQPGNISKACLSCHDGTVAVGNVASGFYTSATINPGAHDGATDYASGGMMTGGALLGADLSNDHPVGIIYNASADGALNTIGAGNLVNGLPVYPSTTYVGSYTVECGSCHNVHNPDNVPFLRVSNTQSTLCVACHIK